MIEEYWNNTPLKIPLGSYAVVGGLKPGVKNDFEKRELTETTFRHIENWEKQGIIKIDKQDLGEKQSKDFSWKDFMETTERGTVKRINISPTKKGLDLERNSRFAKEEGFILLRDGVYKVTKVVRNEAQKKGVDDLRIVMITYDVSWLPEYKSINAMEGRPLSDKRKAMILLKYDAFQSKWIFVTSDIANASDEFKTFKVNNALQ
jgi:hypothetical protein